MTRIRFNDVHVVDMGVGILMNISIPTAYKKQVQAILDTFKAGSEYDVQPHRNKRSLSANAYFWKLADDLAAVLNTTKEEIYKRVIWHAGKFQVLEAVSEEAAESFCKRWCMNGLGWYAYTDKIKPKTIYMYYGSSVYDTKEMARLIDFLQDECRRQHIEVRPKEEVEAMLKQWGENNG